MEREQSEEGIDSLNMNSFESHKTPDNMNSLNTGFSFTGKGVGSFFFKETD